MNRNIIIVLAGGFLIAILVAVMVQAALNGSKKEATNDTRLDVLVAAKDLSVGREIRQGDLRWQKWPEDAMFPGAVLRDADQAPTDAIKGKLLRPLSEGQPVHVNVVVEDDKGDFLSANVTKGMRAVGVPVKSHVLADRLFRPGDFVDVIVTYKVTVSSRKNPEVKSLVNKYATETIIENVRVLAIDNNDTKAIDEAETDGKKTKKKTSKNAIVTLEVNAEGAEELLLATRMGTLGLALRSIGDNSSTAADNKTTDVELSRVMTDLAKMTGATGSGSTVRMYSGSRMTEVKPRGGPVEPDDDVNFSVEEGVQNFEEEDPYGLGEAIMRGLIDAIGAEE